MNVNQGAGVLSDEGRRPVLCEDGEPDVSVTGGTEPR